MSEEKKAINFVWGKPAPSLIPTIEMAAAAQRVFADPVMAIAGMQYSDSPHAGYNPLRQRLSAYLSDFYGSSESLDDLSITGGASQALTVILQILSDPAATRAVWLTAPCFFAARKIFEDAGLTGKLHGVNELEDGSIDLEYLEREMMKLDNPTLMRVPPRFRFSLAQWSGALRRFADDTVLAVQAQFNIPEDLCPPDLHRPDLFQPFGQNNASRLPKSAREPGTQARRSDHLR